MWFQASPFLFGYQPMNIYDKKYDVIVIGDGHAGCEADLAPGQDGVCVLLLAIDLDQGCFH